MKKKLIIYCVALLLMGSTANAAITTDTITYAGYGTNVTSNVSDTFTLDFTDLDVVTSAELEIRAYGVNPNVHTYPVSLEGSFVDNLDGSTTFPSWKTESWDVLSIIDGSNASPELTITGISGLNILYLDYATLTVEFTETDGEPDPDPDPDPQPDPVIPAPGAILLSSIGVGLVGWLRRRKTL